MRGLWRFLRRNHLLLPSHNNVCDGPDNTNEGRAACRAGRCGCCALQRSVSLPSHTLHFHCALTCDAALSDDELYFLRNTERDTVCTNIGLACYGGCPGVTCTDDHEHILEVFAAAATFLLPPTAFCDCHADMLRHRHWSSDNVGILPDTLAGLEHLQVLFAAQKRTHTCCSCS